MAHYRVVRAEEFIRAAEVLVDAGLPNAAVSRAYYAVYHLVVLCLVRFGHFKEPDVNDWKHKTVVSTFERTFSKRGYVFNARDADVVAQLWRDRENADYHAERINQTHAVRSVAAAKALHAKMAGELGDDT